jgi:hypothetical protein
MRARVMGGHPVLGWPGGGASLSHLKVARRRPGPYQVQGASVHPFLPEIANPAGEEPHYGDKIFEIDGVVFAFEELTGIRPDFLLLLRSELARGASSLYEVSLVVEDIVEQLWRRYEQAAGRGRLSWRPHVWPGKHSHRQR